MNRDNGGPAFARPVSLREDGLMVENGSEGMTLRDYFAAKALPAAMTAIWRDIGYKPQDGLSDIQQHARLAYQMADAMILERAK